MTTSSNLSPTHNIIQEYADKLQGDPQALNEWIKTSGISPITPEYIPDNVRQVYVDKATEQLHPWFQNETNYGKAGIKNAVGQTEADYTNTIDQLNQGLSDATSQLSNDSASRGSFGSTAYNERQKSLANQYQNKYQGAFNTANANLQNSLLKNEYNYGTQSSLENMPSISQYNVSPTGQVSTGQSARYNPFGGQGTLNVGMQSAANTMANDYLGARLKNPNYQVRK